MAEDLTTRPRASTPLAEPVEPAARQEPPEERPARPPAALGVGAGPARRRGSMVAYGLLGARPRRHGRRARGRASRAATSRRPSPGRRGSRATTARRACATSPRRRAALPAGERPPDRRRRSRARPSGMDPDRPRRRSTRRRSSTRQHTARSGWTSRCSYIFCGGGTNCAISDGHTDAERAPPAPPRGARARALHLPLRARRGLGRDLPAAAPRRHGRERQTAPERAVLPQGAYGNVAEAPLPDTLAATPGGEQLSLSQAQLVDRLTLPALFRYSLQRSPTRQRRARAQPRRHRRLSHAEALARARARLEPLRLYPKPIRGDVRLVVLPRFFRVPPFRRYDGYALVRTILLRRRRRVRESRDARALPHLAVAAPPVYDGLAYLTTRYRNNPTSARLAGPWPSPGRRLRWDCPAVRAVPSLRTQHDCLDALHRNALLVNCSGQPPMVLGTVPRRCGPPIARKTRSRFKELR